MAADMKRIRSILHTAESPAARHSPLGFGDVTFRDGFWSKRREVNRGQALGYGLNQLRETGTIDNFKIAAGTLSGPRRSRLYSDSDLYKWIEAAAYELGNARAENRSGTTAVEALRNEVDSMIADIAGAQRPDGYLNTFYQLEAGIEKRWTNLRSNHELYCAGHLVQAAIAHHRSTGDATLLLVARRLADHIDAVFGTGKNEGSPGHPEIELALIELYRETSEPRYLRLARFFIDHRGAGHDPALTYTQEHLPIREANEVVGHAVRQLYLLAGATDLYLESGEEGLLAALARLWDSVCDGRMSINGGVGSRYDGEAFGERYELPNDRVYNESCAQIASVMWSWRMYLATGESMYVDLVEWTLYNGVICGVSLDGTRYFYENPLMSRGAFTRQKWFECACCPPNIMRTLSSLHTYLATCSDRGLQLHLYDAAEIDTILPDGRKIRLAIKTRYPWEGRVHIELLEAGGPDPWELSLRIPAWCRTAKLSVNGEVSTAEGGGYVHVGRTWKGGDVVELALDMVPEICEAHPYIETARGSVAVTRGPLVYCLEGNDQPPELSVPDFAIDSSVPLEARWEEGLLGGVTVVEVGGSTADRSGWDGAVYRRYDGAARDDSAIANGKRATAIPYFAWANRAPTPMTVWIPRSSGQR